MSKARPVSLSPIWTSDGVRAEVENSGERCHRRSIQPDGGRTARTIELDALPQLVPPGERILKILLAEFDEPALLPVRMHIPPPQIESIAAL